jgi:hypothetical protein
MPPATFDETTVDIAAATSVPRQGSAEVPGWMAVYNQPVAPAPDIETVAPDRMRAPRKTTRDSSVLPALAQRHTHCAS